MVSLYMWCVANDSHVICPFSAVSKKRISVSLGISFLRESYKTIWLVLVIYVLVRKMINNTVFSYKTFKELRSDFLAKINKLSAILIKESWAIETTVNRIRHLVSTLYQFFFSWICTSSMKEYVLLAVY